MEKYHGRHGDFPMEILKGILSNPSWGPWEPWGPWGVGQAYSDHGVLGPWVRHPGNPVPIGGGVENPLVIRASCGLYLLIFADNNAGPTSGFNASRASEAMRAHSFDVANDRTMQNPSARNSCADELKPIFLIGMATTRAVLGRLLK